MEWLLRLIILLVGVLVIVGIVWAYRRHKSEQELDLGRAARMDQEPPDPIDLDVGKPRVVKSPDTPAHATDRTEPSINGDKRPESAASQPLAEDPQLKTTPSNDETDQWVDGPPAEHAAPAAGHSTRERLSEWLGGTAEDQPTHHNSEPGESELGDQPPTGHTAQATTANRMAAERARTDDREQKAGPLKQRFGKHFTRAAQTEPKPAQAASQPDAAASQSTGKAEQTAPSSGQTASQSSQVAAEAQPEANEIVLSLFIVERQQQPLQAEHLQALIEEMGFEFGAYSIYHFYDLAGNTWLSLMNAVDPGTFDPQDTQSFATPALALFMRVPGSTGNPEIVFDRLVGIANEIASELNAVVLDDQQQPLDAAGIDRYRDLIHTRT